MIRADQFAVASGAVSRLLMPLRSDMRVTVYTSGTARLYVSTTPLTVINADVSAGTLTPANLASRSGTASAWIELPYFVSASISGYTAALVVAESGAATVETTQYFAEQQIRSGLTAEVSLSTQQVGVWGHGEALSLPFAALQLESIAISNADSRDLGQTQWIDGSRSYSVGGRSYGTISARIAERDSPGYDAAIVAAFSSAEYALRIDRKSANGLIAESTLLAVLATSTGERQAQAEQLRSVPLEFQISRPPLRINY